MVGVLKSARVTVVRSSSLLPEGNQTIEKDAGESAEGGSFKKYI